MRDGGGFAWVSGEVPAVPRAAASATPGHREVSWAQSRLCSAGGSLVQALGCERVAEISPSLELKQPPHTSLLQPKSDAILIWVICAKQTGVGCNCP